VDEGVISKQSNGNDVEGSACGTMIRRSWENKRNSSWKGWCFKPGLPEGEAGVLPISTRRRTCGGQCIYRAVAKKLVLYECLKGIGKLRESSCVEW